MYCSPSVPCTYAVRSSPLCRGKDTGKIQRMSRRSACVLRQQETETGNRCSELTDDMWVQDRGTRNRDNEANRCSHKALHQRTRFAKQPATYRGRVERTHARGDTLVVPRQENTKQKQAIGAVTNIPPTHTPEESPRMCRAFACATWSQRSA